MLPFWQRRADGGYNRSPQALTGRAAANYLSVMASPPTPRKSVRRMTEWLTRLLPRRFRAVVRVSEGLKRIHAPTTLADSVNIRSTPR